MFKYLYNSSNHHMQIQSAGVELGLSFMEASKDYAYNNLSTQFKVISLPQLPSKLGGSCYTILGPFYGSVWSHYQPSLPTKSEGIPMAPPLNLLFLPLALLLLLGPSLQQTPSLSPTDLSVLFDITATLRGLPGSHFFSSWHLTSPDPCSSFAGITCSPDDTNTYLRISSLSLGTGLSDSPGLTGTLPASLSTLSFLTELIVFPGRISGTLPPSLSSSLRLVSITSNLISGPIPPSLSTLPSLHTLDLSNNRLTGSIPPPSPSLKTLILASNSLSGALPTNLISTNILHIDLRQNFLSGTLPPLPSTIRYLSASANSLSGQLTALSSTLTDLSFLDLSTNAFTGPIPAAVFELPALSTILLQRNIFSGTITAASGGPIWTVVDLSHNMLSGEIPETLATAGSLYLNSNRLTGGVPASISKSVYEGTMTTFYVQHNFLTGFQSRDEPLPEAVSLCLSYNCMEMPAVGGSGCPDSAGTLLPRPAEQCPATSGSGG